MCGIAGLLQPEGVSPLLLRAMTQTMRHRGPDDEGYVLVGPVGGVAGSASEHRGDDTAPDAAPGAPDVRGARGHAVAGLGHRRLSIIDPSPAGHQPMTDPARLAWVVLNGEIYNYVELRDELRALGHEFRSGSDTEVLLAAYLAWGEACVERLDGQFAFAILDARSGRLFCARDRLGVKPFHYWHDAGRFAFASEIKALLALPWVPRTLNEGLLAAFLVHSRHEDGNQTFFRDIAQLPGGCVLTVAPGEAPEVRRYWTLPAAGVGRFDERAAARAADEVRELLFEAVGRRLRSDVPVGFCISGGLDSSSIVSVAQAIVRGQPLDQVGSHLRAFTSYFEDPGLDERPYAEAVAARGLVEHRTTSPSASSLAEDYARITWHQDEPVSGPGIYMQYDLMRLIAASGVRVVLDGQGGDELFGGYRPHAGAHLRDSLLRLDVREVLRPLASGGLLNVWGHAGHQALHALTGAVAHAVEARLRPGAAALLDAGIVDLARSREHACAATGHLNEVLVRDLTQEMLPHLLRFEDRNSMAHSVEARVPFADSGALAEAVAAQPAAYKIHGGWSKYLLREAMTGIVPEDVRTRRSKLGFTVPQARWAREIASTPLVRGMLEVDQPYITRDRLQQVLAAAAEGQGGSLFWRLLSVFQWLQVVVDAPRPVDE